MKGKYEQHVFLIVDLLGANLNIYFSYDLGGNEQSLNYNDMVI